MSGTNQYLAFGTGTGANTLSYAAYSALTTVIAQGFQPGIALSEQFNTLMRQVSVAAAGTAKFAVDNGTLDCLDDGSPANFAAALLNAVQAAINATQGWKTGDVKTTTDSNMAHHPGWLKLNGQVISRSTYAALFALYGTTFGAGDGSTTFALPDIRGEFLRNWDDGRGIDGSRTLSSFQAAQMKAHKHLMPWGEAQTAVFGQTATAGKTGSNATDADNYWYNTNDGTDYDGTAPGNASGVVGAETRPRNFSVLALVHI
jgi:microcystin-dependent protein